MIGRSDELLRIREKNSRKRGRPKTIVYRPTSETVLDICNDRYEVLLYAILKQACIDYNSKNERIRQDARLFFKRNPYQISEDLLSTIIEKLERKQKPTRLRVGDKEE